MDKGIFCYCRVCGRPIYGFEYCETVDVFEKCDDCFWEDFREQQSFYDELESEEED